MTDEPLPDQTIKLRCPRCRNLIDFHIGRSPRVDVEWIYTTTLSDVAETGFVAGLDATVHLRSRHTC